MKIELRDLQKIYHTISDKKIPLEVRAVDGISLEIPSNEIFGIIGKSGAGKSTLVRLISMMERPDSGEVYYDNERVDNLSEKELVLRRRRIGMIFQNFNLFSSRSAGENIAYPMEIAGKDKFTIKKRVQELLELVELSDRKDARISTLSGGQKQRIAIARALANSPDILFCDEATSALDPGTTKSILNLIRKIQNEMNLTVVMITHQMEVVRDACSKVAVINDGKVVESGNVTDVFMNPKSLVTKDFLSNITSVYSENKNSNDGIKNDEIVRWSKEGGAYQIGFPTEQQSQPVLSEIAKIFKVDFNIRAAGIQHLANGDIGTMLVDFIGDKSEIQKVVNFLQEKGMSVTKLDS